jgi:ADP-ribose pyrophosphatase YjhB (NUDIX family)
MSEQKTKRVSVGVGAIALRGKDVLLVRMNRGRNRGQWSVPGGYVEAGESLEQAAVREVREETGLGFTPGAVVAMRCGVPDRSDREETNLYVAFVGTCGPGDPRADQDEVAEARFFNASAMAASEDVAGLTREVLASALAGGSGFARVSREVGTNNRYKSYDLYR